MDETLAKFWVCLMVAHIYAVSNSTTAKYAALKAWEIRDEVFQIAKDRETN